MMSFTWVCSRRAEAAALVLNKSTSRKPTPADSPWAEWKVGAQVRRGHVAHRLIEVGVVEHW